jgi:hypothetical protein
MMYRNRWIGPVSVLFLVTMSFGCRTAAPAAPIATNFPSALLSVLTYAHDEAGQDFSKCPECQVRVIAPQSIEKYVRLDDSGLEADFRRRVEEAIRENRGRALVLTNVRDPRNGDRPVNIVLLPVPQGSLPGSSDANGVLISNGVAKGCGFRTFGQLGTHKLCASCVFGFCCGKCRCPPCGGDITSATQGLDLPEPLSRLFDGPVELEAYELDTNLVK